jgi:hypothetical protein
VRFYQRSEYATIFAVLLVATGLLSHDEKRISVAHASAKDRLGKPAHLHYSVVSLIPLPWRMDTSTQGWKKIFFLDPDDLLS